MTFKSKVNVLNKKSYEQRLYDRIHDIQDKFIDMIDQQPNRRPRLRINNENGKRCMNLCIIEKCQHMFHFKCLADWCDRNMTCPTCRGEINLEEVYCAEK